MTRGGCNVVFPVTASDTPLEFDVLPALKCTFWPGGSHRIYTLARLYALAGSLHISLCAFEREPPFESMIGFAVSGTEGRILFAGLSPGTAWQQVCAAPSPLPLLGADLSVERFSGVDEQGWYWGARLVLQSEALAQAGCTPKSGAAFRGGLVKYGSGPTGSSYRPVDASRPLDTAALDEFLVVDY